MTERYWRSGGYSKLFYFESSSILNQVLNNDKNKNTGRPEVVINQYPENQTVYPRKLIGPGTNSYNETLAYSQTNSHSIKIFSDSIPKGIRIK